MKTYDISWSAMLTSGNERYANQPNPPIVNCGGSTRVVAHSHKHARAIYRSAFPSDRINAIQERKDTEAKAKS